MAEERLLDGNSTPTDEENSLRPASLDEYIGQEGLKENLRVFIEAAKGRKEALDQVLF